MVCLSRQRALLGAALLALAALVTPGVGSAQTSDSSSSLPLVGARMIDLRAGALLSPGPTRSFSIAGTFQPFVTEHWQLGISPALSASTGSYGSSAGVGLSGVANYMVGSGRARWFAGATAGASGGSGGSGTSYFGAQAGALYFLVPTTALRAELRSRRSGNSGALTSYGAILTLDSYLPAAGSGVTSLPGPGAVDVALDAGLELNRGRVRSIDLMLAPFLTSWAQVGGAYSAVSVPADGGWPTSQRFNGFARLYAPLRPGAMPFVEGFVESARYPYGVLAPTFAGATAGVRHYLNDGIALDAGLEWRRTMAQSSAGVTIPARDYLRLEAGMVTELRLRRGSAR